MIPWGGLSCCLSAAGLYLLGRNSKKDAEILKSVTRVDQLKDLPLILDTSCKVLLPLVVTISGRVGSDTPIHCKHSHLRGVIVKETAEEQFLKPGPCKEKKKEEHNNPGSWIQGSALMNSTSKEVPWYLDDGTGRVHVVGARSATGLELTVASEVLEKSGQSLEIEQVLLGNGQIEKVPLRVKRIEMVLPTGTSLTVVGQAVKDGIGTISIQRPHKGPFYVSPKSIDQLIANHDKWARLYGYASVGFAVFGVCLIAEHAIKYTP